MERVIEITADGIPTLYLPEMEEHYHSVKGALTEAQHVYIGMGLKASPKTNVRLLEVGFGTGLNAFLTLIESLETGRVIHYTSLELYPLTMEQVERLNYGELIAPQHAALFQALHQAPWGCDVAITPHFTLRKEQVALQSYRPTPPIDVIYFDAFAPEKQPELWEEEIFVRLYQASSHEGIITTYCAKGEVRRRMQRAGFVMERLAGPPEGKREILRGGKL